MQHLYCGDCGNYLMVGTGECVDCHCGWKQPTAQEEDHYSCDRCGDEYYFEYAYDTYTDEFNQTVYQIDGWYGECDGQMMCSKCWDDY